MQSSDQVGFPSGFSMLENIQIVNEAVERAMEYKIVIYFSFVD